MALNKNNKQWLLAIILITILIMLIDYLVNHYSAH
jgi:uncharacterized protein YqgC (DUF456 family)